MSGFFGILRSDGREVASDLLQRFADALRFRGPDGENIWHQLGTGACFSYLATGPARQATQQPVSRGADWLIGDLPLRIPPCAATSIWICWFTTRTFWRPAAV